MFIFRFILFLSLYVFAAKGRYLMLSFPRPFAIVAFQTTEGRLEVQLSDSPLSLQIRLAFTSDLLFSFFQIFFISPHASEGTKATRFGHKHLNRRSSKGVMAASPLASSRNKVG